jgi:hypothetical protein
VCFFFDQIRKYYLACSTGWIETFHLTSEEQNEPCFGR